MPMWIAPGHKYPREPKIHAERLLLNPLGPRWEHGAQTPVATQTHTESHERRLCLPLEYRLSPSPVAKAVPISKRTVDGTCGKEGSSACSCGYEAKIARLAARQSVTPHYPSMTVAHRMMPL
jgi:hypothetical protein